MEGVIYSYKSPSGKYYIGQTIQEEVRKRQHRLSTATKMCKFGSAIKKYGFDNLEYNVIVRIQAEKENEKALLDWLDKLEDYYINKYDSLNNGYNTIKGGRGVWNRNTEGEYSLTYREKLSKAKKGKAPWNKGKTGIYSDEFRAEMSRVRKGQVPVNKGKKENLAPEQRKRISDARKGKLPAKARAIDVYDLKGNLLYECKSQREASEKTTVNEVYLSKCVRGMMESSKGYKFVYHESSTTIESTESSGSK
jgi:group I intron endonuclease